MLNILWIKVVLHLSPIAAPKNQIWASNISQQCCVQDSKDHMEIEQKN